jgi:hypothetical protein
MRLRLDDFMPPTYILNRATAAERIAWRAEVAITVKQALVVTLTYAVQVGRKRYRAWRDRFTGERTAVRALVTVTGLFDQLAERWSDNYRALREQYPGIRVRDFTPESARACWDDLRRNGIDLNTFWNILVKHPRLNPLFRAAWRKNKSGRKLGDRGRGYVIELNPGATLDTFERLLREDPSYTKPDGRLLFADERTPKLRVRQNYAGDRPYDVVELGDRSRNLLEIMGGTRLLFDADAFREDVQKTKLKAARDDAEGTRMQAHLAAMLPIEAQLREAPLPAWTNEFGETFPNLVQIKSGFSRLRNRRYQPTHFWPSATTGKVDDTQEPDDSRGWGPRFRVEVYDPDLGGYRPIKTAKGRLHSSPRWRWFLVAGPDTNESLVGADVSSSGTQILAVLLGLDELEARASSSEPTFKQFLAELAWEKPELRARYSGPDDAKLVEDVKTFWMRILYGASPRTPGEGSRKMEPTFKNLPDGWTLESAKDFLQAVPQYADVERFQAACKKIGRTIAHPQHPDRYRGAVFVDPYDGAEVRWNPVKRVRLDIARGPVRLILNVPGHFDKKSKKAVLHEPNPVNGEYPVDRAELSRRIAPCLVHILDAYFASLVIEQLAARGVRDFVSIHDGWLVPENVPKSAVRRPPPDVFTWGLTLGLDALGECMEEAEVEWLKGLGVIYERLLYYLSGDPMYGDTVRAWEARWRARVEAQRWPRFAVKAEELTKLTP